MPDYQKLYMLLFNACTDAVNHIDLHNFGMARQALICGQQAAEELYIQNQDDEAEG